MIAANENDDGNCYIVIQYPGSVGGARGLQEDASGFAQAVLVGLEPPPTFLSPSRWGSLKRLLRW